MEQPAVTSMQTAYKNFLGHFPTTVKSREEKDHVDQEPQNNTKRCGVFVVVWFFFFPLQDIDMHVEITVQPFFFYPRRFKRTKCSAVHKDADANYSCLECWLWYLCIYYFL